MSSSRIPTLGPRGEGWVALQLVLLALIAFAPLTGWEWRPRIGLTGVATMLVGIGVAAMGVRDLRSSLSALPAPRRDAMLVTTGIYGVMRHPIYVGLICVAVGWGVATYSLLAELLTAVLIVVLDLKSRREEMWLRERFPEYAAYAARTKRFIPGVY